MTKLEKVLKGLKCCQENLITDGDFIHENCPYVNRIECKYFLFEDALELLKAQQWVKFEKRELTEEEKTEHPEWCYMMENTPDDGEEILVSNGRYVWKDEFINDGDGCYLDSDHDMEDCWWMPLPEPPKEGESE